MGLDNHGRRPRGGNFEGIEEDVFIAFTIGDDEGVVLQNVGEEARIAKGMDREISDAVRGDHFANGTSGPGIRVKRDGRNFRKPQCKPDGIVPEFRTHIDNLADGAKENFFPSIIEFGFIEA